MLEFLFGLVGAVLQLVQPLLVGEFKGGCLLSQLFVFNADKLQLRGSATIHGDPQVDQLAIKRTVFVAQLIQLGVFGDALGRRKARLVGGPAIRLVSLDLSFQSRVILRVGCCVGLDRSRLKLGGDRCIQLKGSLLRNEAIGGIAYDIACR